MNNIIHITTPSGSRFQYEESLLRSLWQQGLLQEGTRYWKNGMSEWRPIAECFSPVPSALPAPPAWTLPPIVAPSTYSYFIDPRSLTSSLIVMLWVSFGLTIFSLLELFNQMNVLTDARRNGHQVELSFTPFDMICFLAFIVNGIAFLMWIYRANLNCRGFGAKDMEFTPGWSIGYYFIPFLNFWKPYQAMKEIYQVSHNPKNWKSQQGSAVLNWWWGLAVCSLLSALWSMALYDENSLSDLEASTGLSLVGYIIDIPLHLVAIALVTSIGNAQESIVNRRPSPTF